MIEFPEPLEDLIHLLKRLPGVGQRGAERMVLSLLDWDPALVSALGGRISSLRSDVAPCPVCGAISLSGRKCSVCSDVTRDSSLLCVVEDSRQIFAIENGGGYRGLYHVLGGRLSPLSGEMGENLSTEPLLARVAPGSGVEEVILALGSDVEGGATAAYVASLLKDSPVRITKPAQGLPAGADLSFADGATIRAAFSGRRGMD